MTVINNKKKSINLKKEGIWMLKLTNESIQHRTYIENFSHEKAFKNILSTNYRLLFTFIIYIQLIIMNLMKFLVLLLKNGKVVNKIWYSLKIN